MWGCFLDRSYFDMWAIRHKHHRKLTDAIHVITQKEAQFLVQSLNELDKLRTMCKCAAAEILEHWEAHCDGEGYGPRNLIGRLKGDLPPDYYPAYLDK